MSAKRWAALLVGVAALVLLVGLVWLGSIQTPHFSLVDPIPPGWTPGVAP
ncbi:MAG: hypothetical protein MUE92_00715 [Chloroflexi bacterium]|jgi:hypothetical protein|nr:hypothetical protein [Chloroflexota bacterium]